MRSPVIAIGLDAADPKLLEAYMAQGHLKNISQVRQQGAYGRLNNIVNYCDVPTPAASTERLWAMTWTGCMPDQTGFWGTSSSLPTGTRSVEIFFKLGVTLSNIRRFMP